jgi:glycosyltransferase involved in cell wall biosynthesis
MPSSMTRIHNPRPTSPPRLLVVTGAAGYEQDGTIFVPSEQAERFRELPRRFDTTFVIKRSPARSDTTTPLPHGLRATWIEPYTSKWRLLSPRHFLALWNESKRSDAVLSLMPLLDGLPPLALAFVARRPRYMYVIASSIHFRYEANGNTHTRRLARVMLNACALISTRVFVNGRGLADELWRPFQGKITEAIISTISTDDLLPVERETEGRIELLSVCRLVPSKRVDVALDMTKLLLDRGIDVRLTVVGDGPLRDVLFHQAEKLSLGDHVTFTGYVDDRRSLRTIYGRSHVFVLCTEMEGVSLAIQEAMAAGLAVVSTNRGALAQFLHHDIDSLVIDRIDPVAFADALTLLASSSATRLRLARAGREKVSRLDNAAWVDRVADLIELDLHGQRRARRGGRVQ